MFMYWETYCVRVGGRSLTLSKYQLSIGFGYIVGCALRVRCLNKMPYKHLHGTETIRNDVGQKNTHQSYLKRFTRYFENRKSERERESGP